ncbi:MAG: ATP-binding protein [Euryhalocaulis sp.]|nr:ATP-binding protein [Euryhalocaulis sp.]
MKFGKKATCVCRCGDGGVSGIACKRGPRCAIDYQARISGPMMDRIDLQIDVPAVSAADLALPPPAEGSAEVAARVAAARSAQLSRGEGAEGGHTNADITTAMIEQVAAPDEAGRALLAKAAEKMKLSARAYHRTLRVARTIADLDGADSVRRVHIAEALSHRRAPPESYAGQSGSRAASAR